MLLPRIGPIIWVKMGENVVLRGENVNVWFVWTQLLKYICIPTGSGTDTKSDGGCDILKFEARSLHTPGVINVDVEYPGPVNPAPIEVAEHG